LRLGISLEKSGPTSSKENSAGTPRVWAVTVCGGGLSAKDTASPWRRLKAPDDEIHPSCG